MTTQEHKGLVLCFMRLVTKKINAMRGLYQSWKDSGKTRAEFAKENGLVK